MAPEADVHDKAAFVKGTRPKTLSGGDDPAFARGVTVRTRKPGAVRRTTIYFEHEVFSELRLYCAQADRDLSAVVSQAVLRFLRADVSAGLTSKRLLRGYELPRGGQQARALRARLRTMATSDNPTEHVLDSALALPENDRALVATALLASLTEPPGPRDDDPAFVAELVRRAERVESGASTARDWEDVERDVRTSLRR